VGVDLLHLSELIAAVLALGVILLVVKGAWKVGGWKLVAITILIGILGLAWFALSS
jgi:hypothetical protein